MTATRSAPWRTSRSSSTAEWTSRERILLRGASLLRLAAILAALLLLPPFLRGAAPGLAAIVLTAVAVGVGIGARARWWVLRIHRDDLDAALLRSCRMVLAVPTVTAEGVRVQLARTQLLIRIRSCGVRAFELRFDGPWRTHRKARLVRSVIAKQFEPPIPRIRIRLRRVRTRST